MDENSRRVMHSSAKSDWGTPQKLFDHLDRLFKFKLDVCATDSTAKCNYYFDKEDDGLDRQWPVISCWMNPPYGRGIGAWIDKAAKHKCVALLPARPDTRWFQTVWEHAETICFMQGRVKFEGAQNGAPFPTAIAVFGHCLTAEHMAGLEELGRCVRWKR